MANVKFLHGSYTNYETLKNGSGVDKWTFYLTATDGGENYDRLFLGELEITDTDFAEQIKKLSDEIGTLDHLKTENAKDNLVNAINSVYDKIGDLSDVKETPETVAAAITALYAAIEEEKTAEKVSVEKVSKELNEKLYAQYRIKQGEIEAETTIDIDKITLDPSSNEGEGPKKYTLKQGDTVIGVIDIPKDLVVRKGELIVVADEGSSEETELENGTYIKLILNDETESKVYINVTKLIDTYKPDNNGKDIEINIEGYTISANIGDGKVTEVKLEETLAAKIAKIDEIDKALTWTEIPEA